MTEQEYEEMMSDLNNDPDYIAYCEQKTRETREAMDLLTDAEIAEIFGIVG